VIKGGRGEASLLRTVSLMIRRRKAEMPCPSDPLCQWMSLVLGAPGVGHDDHAASARRVRGASAGADTVLTAAPGGRSEFPKAFLIAPDLPLAQSDGLRPSRPSRHGLPRTLRAAPLETHRPEAFGNRHSAPRATVQMRAETRSCARKALKESGLHAAPDTKCWRSRPHCGLAGWSGGAAPLRFRPSRTIRAIRKALQPPVEGFGGTTPFHGGNIGPGAARGPAPRRRGSRALRTS